MAFASRIEYFTRTTAIGKTYTIRLLKQPEII